MSDIQITDITENSARLRWASPEPHNAYVFDLSITLAHDHSLVLKQNLTGTERVIGGLRGGQKYLVVITGYLKSQPKVTYTGTFSTSKYPLAKTNTFFFFMLRYWTHKKIRKKCVRDGEPFSTSDPSPGDAQLCHCMFGILCPSSRTWL